MTTIEQEQRCRDCFFADHYLPGDDVTVENGETLKVGKEFYARGCVTNVGLFFRRLFDRGDFERVVLPKDDSCATKRFIPK